MTDHNIKELERQYQQAQSRESQAIKATQEARYRLQAARIAQAEAEMEARGIRKGDRVRWRDGISAGTQVGIYIGHAPSTFGAEVKAIVRKPTKAGAPHPSHRLMPDSWNGNWEKAE